MRRTKLVIVSFLLILNAVAPLRAVQVEALPVERAPEIDAECWFNAQRERIHDAPRLILLEFCSIRSHECREFVEALSSIHEAFSDDEDVVGEVPASTDS